MNSVEILGGPGDLCGRVGGRRGNHVPSWRRKGLYRKLVFSEGRLKAISSPGVSACAGIFDLSHQEQDRSLNPRLEREMSRGFSYRPRLYALGGSVQTVELGGMKL